jgi:sterol desaturase/sphingolipid hydroxylase (fatty acid hydroxylase superfamily)
MGLVSGTIAIYLAINVVGVLWTACILKWGIPKSMRLQDRPHTWETFRQRIPLVLFNTAVLLIFTGFGLHALRDLFDATQPAWSDLALGLVVVFVLDDIVFYAWHRVLHENKWLYNKIHRIHHKAFSPLPYEFLYVHPIEWMVGTLGPILGFTAVALIWGSIPVWTLWSFAILRNVHELDIHSGIRSVVGTKIPFFGATEHHDLHHAKPTKGNYSSVGTFWDKVLGTYWRPETDKP